jgi:hypothetical protein
MARAPTVSVGPASGEGAPGPAHEQERRLHRAFARTEAAVVVASAILFFSLATQWTFRPDLELPSYTFGTRFFLAQAHSLTEGNLAVRPKDLPGECFVHDGKCYGYFGLTPSLLRAPFLPVLDELGSLTPLFICAALTLALWAAVDMMRRAWLRAGVRGPPELITFALMAIGLGVGSVLVQLTRPAMYEEAIVWAIAFLLLAIRAVWRWTDTESRVQLGVALVCLVLGAGARPTVLPAAVVLGGFILWRAVLARRVAWAFSALAIVALPSVFVLGVYWLKFETLIPDLRINESVHGSPSAAAIFARNGGATTSAKFIPTSLFAYLRPDGIVFGDAFPWVQAHSSVAWLPPLRSGGAYIEPVGSATTTMPLLVIAAIGAGCWAIWALVSRPDLRETARTVGVLLVAAASCLVVTLTWLVIVNRYLGDFYPLLATGTAAAPLFLAKMCRSSGRWGLVAIVAGLCAWGVFVNLALSSAVWP